MKKHTPSEPSGIRLTKRVSSQKLRSPENVNGLRGIKGSTAQSFAGAAGMLIIIHALLYGFFRLLSKNNVGFSALIAGKSINSFIVGGVLTQGIMIFLPMIFVIRFYKMPAVSISGEKSQAGGLLLGFMAGIPAAVVFQGLNNLLIYLLVKAGWQLPTATTPYNFDTSLVWNSVWQVKLVIIIVSAIIPALVEELMFRGVIQGSLSARGSAGAVIFWQAIAFMLFHNDPLFLLPPFLSGLLLGLLRYKSKSIIPAVLCHLSMNLSLLALAPFLPRLTQSMLEISTQTTESLLYASLIASCIAAVALVPMVILISGLSHSRYQKATDTGKPGLLTIDLMFALAIMVLLVTIILSYYNSLPN
jgi:membrane protease YdiL (CAAX protease family)